MMLSKGADDGKAKTVFSKEFKLSAVRLVNQQKYSPGEAARSLGIDAGNVRNWVERLRQG